ncbi:MAG: HD-GYP domain-containing protein [bacterium]|nr:HD-GYP domain-containing protein [bacterium]
MKNNELEDGISLFSRSVDMMEEDPLEEIFALNLGDFISEHLISDDLAAKIGKNVKNKNEGLKNQLKELISIYSLDNTLCVLGFSSKEDYIIYNSIAKNVVQMLDMDACHIYLTREFAKGLDKSDKDLILVGSSIDFDDDIYAHDIGYKIEDKTFVSDSFIKRETIEAKNPKLSNKFIPCEKLNEDKVKILTAIPMHNNANAVGVIVIESYADKFFKDEYLKLIEVTATLFSTSMSLQKLVEEASGLIEEPEVSANELQHMRAELTALIGDLGDQQQLFVKNLASAVDAKGQYKISHSENTANLARMICKKMGLNEKTTDLIYYAGLLQNIGKITLPESIFTHKGPLTPEEWSQLQNHPNVGINLLMNINFLSEVVPYIHYHKERWDGRGEPEGLRGCSIPLGSRIIAVADSFSAMTADRSYRKALLKEQALEEIKKESETKWDPAVVAALIEAVADDD